MFNNLKKLSVKLLANKNFAMICRGASIICNISCRFLPITNVLKNSFQEFCSLLYNNVMHTCSEKNDCIK